MFSTRGGEVRIYDPNVAHAQAAVDYVAKTLRDVIAKRGSGEPGKATAHDSVADALDGAWLAIESVPERLTSRFRWARSTPQPPQTPSSQPTPRPTPPA